MIELKVGCHSGFDAGAEFTGLGEREESYWIIGCWRVEIHRGNVSRDCCNWWLLLATIRLLVMTVAIVILIQLLTLFPFSFLFNMPRLLFASYMLQYPFRLINFDEIFLILPGCPFQPLIILLHHLIKSLLISFSLLLNHVIHLTDLSPQLVQFLLVV